MNSSHFEGQELLVIRHEAPELIEAAITHIEYFVLGSMKKAMEYCSDEVDFYWCGDKIIRHLLRRR